MKFLKRNAFVGNPTNSLRNIINKQIFKEKVQESAKHMRSQWVFFKLRYLFTENRKIAFQAFSLLLRDASVRNCLLDWFSTEGKVFNRHIFKLLQNFDLFVLV